MVNVPGVASGFGWVAAEFVVSSADPAQLPVVDNVSPQTPAVDEKGSEGGATGRSGISQVPVAYAPSPVGQQPAAKALVAVQQPASTSSVTGLTGKLVIQTQWGGDIHVYNLVTGELRLLTGGFDPALSPDGREVAFTRNGGENGIYIINVDGSNERLIYSGNGRLTSPKWSPDGGWIVFTRGDEYSLCRQFGRTCLDPATFPSDFVFDDEINPLVREYKHLLSRVDRDGKNYRDLATLEVARASDWNEAGIVYQSSAGIQVTQDQPDATTREVYYDRFKQEELDPDWQPGGGRIVFQRRELSHWEIFSVNPDGSGFTALTRPTFTLVDELPSNVAPAWSPDGRHIVFLSNRMPNQSAGAWNVWVMDSDGGNQRQLPIDLPFTYTFVAEQILDWGP
jgi:Tol biopolymer transport system component